MLHAGESTTTRSGLFSSILMLYCCRVLHWPQLTHFTPDITSDLWRLPPTIGRRLSPLQVRQPSATVEHEASTSKIGEDQLFYFQQRGIDPEAAVGVIISGFCRQVFNQLPLEFAAEVNELMSLKLEGSVG
jgi:SUF system FeS cluster assembly, SufBD